MDPARATSAAEQLPLAAAAAARCGPGPLSVVAETGSTNEDLAAQARAGVTDGAVLVADHQVAGRGRLDRRWEDRPGEALLVSLRVPVEDDDPGRLVMAVGAAARAAADGLVPVPVTAKWPNDLVVRDGPAPGKLAGILAEYVPASDAGSAVVVIGVGCNVAPVGGRAGATSLTECGGTAGRDPLLAALLEGFAARRADPASVLEELRRHSATLGTRVRVELPGDRQLTGLAVDLDPAGRLVVRDDGGEDHVVAVGDVVHLRPA